MPHPINIHNNFFFFVKTQCVCVCVCVELSLELSVFYLDGVNKISRFVMLDGFAK